MAGTKAQINVDVSRAAVRKGDAFVVHPAAGRSILGGRSEISHRGGVVRSH